jgi:electron transfer flavoprotein alpha subunit
MVEELEIVLGAAAGFQNQFLTGWRPHGEHVGQTGKPVASCTGLNSSYNIMQESTLLK